MTINKTIMPLNVKNLSYQIGNKKPKGEETEDLPYLPAPGSPSEQRCVFMKICPIVYLLFKGEIEQEMINIL